VCELDSRIPQLLRAGFAEEKDGAVHIDVSILGIDKVLGTGRVNRALTVSASTFSKNAITKIENAGGTVIHT